MYIYIPGAVLGFLGGSEVLVISIMHTLHIQFTLRCLNQVITSCLNGFYYPYGE